MNKNARFRVYREIKNQQLARRHASWTPEVMIKEYWSSDVWYDELEYASDDPEEARAAFEELKKTCRTYYDDSDVYRPPQTVVVYDYIVLVDCEIVDQDAWMDGGRVLDEYVAPLKGDND